MMPRPLPFYKQFCCLTFGYFFPFAGLVATTAAAEAVAATEAGGSVARGPAADTHIAQQE